MMGRHRQSPELGEHAIFGNEEAAQLRAELAGLCQTVAELGDRVHAQFTTISAHAEIAREQVAFAREESRADLDRTREMLIELVERARVEAGAVRAAGTAPGASVATFTERLDGIEGRMLSMSAAIDRCFDRQRELADTMAAMLDTVLSERRGEPATGLSLA